MTPKPRRGRARLDARSYLILALRNLWRNPKRTLLTLFSMVLGIAALTLLSALNDGWLKEMQDNFILAVTGHVQVHAQGFEASQNLRDGGPPLVLEDRNQGASSTCDRG